MDLGFDVVVTITGIALVFLILALFKLNPIYIIVLSMPLGILYTLYCTYRIKRNEVLK